MWTMSTADPRRRQHLQRVPPHDNRIEASLLGAALLSRDAAVVCAGVEPTDFYSVSHGRIADAIRFLVDAGKGVDPGTVSARLRETGQLDGVNGSAYDDVHHEGTAYLVTLQVECPAIGNAPTYAEMVTGYARKRRQLALAADIVEGVYAHTDIGGLVAELNAVVEDAAVEAASTWEPVNLAQILAGKDEETRPAYLRRSDGQCLLYPGRIHAFNAESESGKSWLAQWACLERVESGDHVLFIDFEDEAVDVVGRLLAMGAEPGQLLERFHYVRPDDPIDMGARLRVVAMLKAWPVTLCVVDGVAEAMGMSGWNEDKTPDVVAFYTALPRAVARRGAAVILIDHLTKDREKQGDDARGSGHKRAGITASYKLLRTAPFGRDRTGRARLIVTKDRPGFVRGFASDDGKVAGELVLESSHGGTAVTVLLRPTEESGGAEGWDGPTQCMAAIEAVLAETGEEMSGRQLVTALRARDLRYRDSTIWESAERLALEGRLRVRSGPRNSRIYQAADEPSAAGEMF